ncbi:ATP-binding protein [Chitinophaga caseinilytica]|uniref:ATP-binding protein n=1 Tax=Chitinophaga caseinilytica TaxID=2267521 RepID=UPI003C2B8EC2
MNIIAPITRLLDTGCTRFPEEKRCQVRIINSLSLAIGSSLFMLGVVYYFISRAPIVFFGNALALVCFCIPVIFNRYGKLKTATLLLVAFQSLWAVYFDWLLGPGVLFIIACMSMISLTYLTIEKQSWQIIAVATLSASIVIMEWHLLNGNPPYLQQPEPVIRSLRWINIAWHVFIPLLCIYHYKKSYNDLLKELLAKRDELEKSNKSRKLFLQETSHEIRNPLNAIFGIVQLMRMDLQNGRPPETMGSLVDHLYVASFNVKDIINNVLELSRIESGQRDEAHPAEVRTHSFLHNIVRIYELLALTKSVTIRLSISPRMLPVVTTDEVKLSQILNNLMTNAIKFSPGNSEILVECGVAEKEWHISVTDQGGGIPEDKQKVIFEPFVTVKKSFVEGTGLGLHISKYFAELLGGRIEVNCVDGVSTTFTISFPIPDGATIPELKDETPGRTSFAGSTVLVVEDDRMSQIILRNFLRAKGIHVLAADNGNEGLTIAREQSPNLIILDSQMPNMNGSEMLEHLKSDPRLQHIPVVIASGDAYSESADKFRLQGACDYVVKPIELTALGHVLEKHLQHL